MPRNAIVGMVVYDGTAEQRTITRRQWLDAGVTDQDPVTWNAQNGWALPISAFVPEAQDILDNLPEFLFPGEYTPVDHPAARYPEWEDAYPLADTPLIVTDGSKGNFFTLLIGGNRTLSNPVNVLPDQRLMWRVRQDATGGRTLSFGSKFNFNPGVTPSTSIATSPGAKTYIAGIYDAVKDQIDILAFGPGY